MVAGGASDLSDRGAPSTGRADATLADVRARTGDDYGGAFAAPTRAASVVRRRRRDLGASPAASRRRSSSWRATKASATARLRTTRAQARNKEQGHGDEPHHPAPAPGHVDGGGVLHPGVRSLCSRSARRRAAPGRCGVVVAPGGLGVDRGWHGDRDLRAAGRAALCGGERQAPCAPPTARSAPCPSRHIARWVPSSSSPLTHPSLWRLSSAARSSWAAVSSLEGLVEGMRG